MRARFIPLVVFTLLVAACGSNAGGESGGDPTTSTQAEQTTTSTEAEETTTSTEVPVGPLTETVPGIWDVGIGDGSTDYQLWIETIEERQQDGSWVGPGCMGVPGALMAPAAVRLTEEPDGGLELTVTATLVFEETADRAVVAQLRGGLRLGAAGFEDDAIGGADAVLLAAGREPLDWHASHGSLESEGCPPVVTEGTPLSLFHNLGVHIQVADGEETVVSGWGSETNVVSSGMRVSTPGGETMLADSYTDIFTPWVDFVENFRYSTQAEGFPIVGQPYGFVLLDALGRPLAGTEGEDVWERCDLQEPVDLALAVLDDGSLRVSWESPPIVFGFDPARSIGLFQVQVNAGSGEMVVGAETDVTEHVFPWADFGGEAPGEPSGMSFGAGLEDLPDGRYTVAVSAYANDWEDPLASSACSYSSRDQDRSFTKEAGRITIP